MAGKTAMDVPIPSAGRRPIMNLRHASITTRGIIAHHQPPPFFEPQLEEIMWL
jgi:hypothetical protein